MTDLPCMTGRVGPRIALISANRDTGGRGGRVRARALVLSAFVFDEFRRLRRGAPTPRIGLIAPAGG